MGPAGTGVCLQKVSHIDKVFMYDIANAKYEHGMIALSFWLADTPTLLELVSAYKKVSHIDRVFMYDIAKAKYEYGMIAHSFRLADSFYDQCQ